MKINGIELEDIDILDADMAEKYEGALRKVEEEAKASKSLENINFSAVIRKQCSAVFDCFNTLFGNGTDKKIFGDKVNLMTCLKAFEELVQCGNKQKEELEKIADKYSPNRAQRRSKK